MLGKDVDITIRRRRGYLEPFAENVTVRQTPGSVIGEPLACEARFVPFPSLETAPEMAGTVPPEDTTLYVAADGTGEFGSIQQAGANGIQEKHNLLKPHSMPNTIPPVKARGMISAIHMRIF